MASNTVDDVATITVNGNTINPEAAANVSENAQDSNFIYVQGQDDLTVDQKRQLASLHVDILEYVAEYTYLCRYVPEDLERVRTLPFVRAVNIYHPELKSTITLKQMVEGDEDQTEYEVDVILHDRPNVSPAALAPYVSEAARVPMDELEVCSRKIRLTVHQDRLDDLAALDSVNRIEEVEPKVAYNDRARSILHAGVLATSMQYEGAGQKVCVADTGFDQGKADNDMHPAFKGRVSHFSHFGVISDARDPVGHGTHVAGSVCGNGVYTPTSNGASPVTIKGTAPAAELVVQSMSSWSDKTKRWGLKAPAELGNLFLPAYDLKVRVHNNSWGDRWNSKKGQLDYNEDAGEIDQFIHDHQDFVVLIAAGNDGDEENAGESQIGDNGAAKNCITVGATGTTRPNDGEIYDAGKTAVPLSGIFNTAKFSSRGPTKATKNSQGESVTGRIKPDVVAPGIAILSAASRMLDSKARVRTDYGPSEDKDWLFMSGTSMATPLVSGCAALLREVLREQGKEKPSAALIKALLVNGAVNYSSPNGPGFDYEQGFGRVDIDQSIGLVKSGTFVDGGNVLETSAWDAAPLRVVPDAARHWEKSGIVIPSGRFRLVATLVYTDPPHKLLQNDVNLIARAGGQERHGNMGTGTDFDHTNNVEKVIWDNIPGPTATVAVYAYGFTKTDSEQSFAVAWEVQPM